MTEKTDNIQFKDKTLLCVECANPFVFTAGEQRFFHSKGLAVPKRCAQCRLLRKLTLDRGGENETA